MIDKICCATRPVYPWLKDGRSGKSHVGKRSFADALQETGIPLLLKVAIAPARALARVFAKTLNKAVLQ